jgi:hypothetical protein
MQDGEGWIVLIVELFMLCGAGEDIDARILKISTGLSICEEWQHVSCGIFLMA